MAVKLFFCYAHEDEELLNKLKTHLAPLQWQGLIETWHDRAISPGTEWEEVIKEHLNTDQIIILLVSPDFMASKYCYSIEMQHAVERHDHKEACVIPVILRHVYWQAAPFGKLQALPKDARPVKSWPDQDEAFFNVAEGIKTAVQKMMSSVNNKTETKNSQEGLFTKTPPRSFFITTSPKPDQKTTSPERVQKSKVQWLHEGHLLYNLKRYEEALAVSEQAIDLDPNDADACINKSYALHGLKRYQEVLAISDQAIRINPNFVAAYNIKGAALDGLKRYEEALAAYEQGIRIDPNYAPLYNNIGYVLENLGREREAQQAFEKAYQLEYGG